MISWRRCLRAHGDRCCFVGGQHSEQVSYPELIGRIAGLAQSLHRAGVVAGSVVAFPGQYSADHIAILIALANMRAVAVPLPNEAESRIERLMKIGQVTHRVVTKACGEGIAVRWVRQPSRLESACVPPKGAVGHHALYETLRELGHAGLVLFTSGTTGEPKAALQDLNRLRLRYAAPRPAGRLLGFMQMDHIGGINTLLYVLCNGGTLVVPRSRSPEDVARSIEMHRIEVLPVSPTFLNLFLMSGVCDRHDLSSLRRITYGSEPMPASVLARLNEQMPNVELLQTYGTTELGILKTRSEDNGSLWMQVGGAGFETKVVDGRLWVKAETAMMGYLNSDSPFDDDGYMDTGDMVEQRGEWLRIVGRKSEAINVGGIKVSPVEVESALLEMPAVLEASVVGVANGLTGQIVEARIRLREAMSLPIFKQQMRRHCAQILPAEAIPAKVTFVQDGLVTDRFKRARLGSVQEEQAC